MSKDNTTLPKYQLVKDYVLLQIENNALGDHDRIPSEAEFSKLLDVSSITVRKALTELVNEGIIYRVRGKGSFVSDRTTPAATAIDNGSNYVTFIMSGNQNYDSSYMQIIKGVQSFLSQRECKLVIEFVDNDFERERELILKLIQSETRGLLIYSADPNAAKAYLSEIRKKSIPFVMLDRIPSGYPVDSITCNNHDGAYEAVAYMIAQGHRNIGFAAYDFHLSTEADRYDGYRQALTDASLVPADDILFFEQELDYARLIGQIKKRALSALFCVNDRRALEVIEQLTSQGIDIPEQLSVMGFDDFESSKFAKVALSTVKQNFDVLGYEGAKLLFDIEKDNPRVHKKMLLSTQLIIRNSTGKL